MAPVRQAWWALCFVVACHGSTEPKSSSARGGFGDDIVESLRQKGKSYLSQRDYSNAARCYTAVLQVIEGKGGPESGKLRRRCYLTLAECEIKMGHLDNAIARCSEVIEEMPSIDALDAINNTSSTNSSSISSSSSSGSAGLEAATHGSSTAAGAVDLEEIRQAYGKAHYRRGLALDRSNRPLLALLDLRAAHSNLPADESILSRIVEIEAGLSAEREARRGGLARRGAVGSLGGRGGEGEGEEEGDGAEGEEQDEEEGGTSRGGTRAAEGKEGWEEEESDSALDERLRAVAEEAQQSSPLLRLSEKQILALLEGGGLVAEPFRPGAELNLFPDMSGMGGMGGLGALGGMGGLGALGGMGGLGALGGMGGLGALGALGGIGQGPGKQSPLAALSSLASSGQLPGLISGLAPMLGLDPQTATLLGDIVRAVTDVGLMMGRLYASAVRNQVLIVRAVLVLLLLHRFTPLGKLLF